MNDTTNLKTLENNLKERIKSLDSVIVAYSGGVDSSLLAFYADLELKHKALIAIAVSPSLASFELEFARQQAQKFNWPIYEIITTETTSSEYQENNLNRCYICKSTLFTELTQLAKEKNIQNIIYGANLDDLNDFRPGHKAAYEFNIIAPLIDCKLNKKQIRELAKLNNLPSADKPQSACLSSRFPTYIKISDTKLATIDKAEKFLHDLGFKQVRVRHHDELARIELESDEISKLLENENSLKLITEYFKSLGYKFVTLDLNGYRMGSSVVTAGKN